uniref:Uncharacterized protein n=1 Tax=Corethron hystrix TaxID=216773 RepID=A0A7S1B8N1_9STRA|mmetsp:Transcript_15734/g.35418  ORF Transcript_15734/g.35418 Transcript_15734/m.35418 type:complete len:159 (+) Transcript_15734:156-632(+)
MMSRSKRFASSIVVATAIVIPCVLATTMRPLRRPHPSLPFPSFVPSSFLSHGKEKSCVEISMVETQPDLPRRRRGLPFKEPEPGDDRLSPSRKASDPMAIPKRELLVGNPQQKVQAKSPSIDTVMKELAAIQQQGPRKYCILGTRHCSFLHQQIIELL